MTDDLISILELLRYYKKADDFHLINDIKNHVEYPGLISIIDVLDKFNIPTKELIISESNIDKINVPILVLLKDKKQNCRFTLLKKDSSFFTIINNGVEQVITLEELRSKWLGFCLFFLNENQGFEIIVEENIVENNINIDNKNLYGRIIGMRNNLISKSQIFNANFDIIGNDNVIIIKGDTFLPYLSIKIYGDSNIIEIGNSCRVTASFNIEGNNSKIYIDDFSTIESAILSANESKSIFLGKDCMLSDNIFITTSDSHTIYDVSTGVRLNNAKNVVINNHVWLCTKVSIMKGVNIGSNSIIATASVVTKNVPENSLFGGVPSKIIKSNVSWKRELE